MDVLAPDALEKVRATAKLRFRAVDDSVRFAGGAVVAYAFKGNSTEGALGVYLPADRFLWAGDFISGHRRLSLLLRCGAHGGAMSLGIHPEKVGAQHIALMNWSDVDKRVPVQGPPESLRHAPKPVRARREKGASIGTMRRRVWIALLLIAAWSIPGLLAASFNVVLFPAVRREGTLLYIGIQVGYWWIWVALTPAIVAVTRRYPLERTQLRTSLPMHVLALLGCTLIYTLWYAGVGKTLLPTMGERPRSFLQLLRGSIGGRMALGPLLYAAVVGMTVAVDERTRRREHDLHTARLQAELAKAQLQALQMQLQPHFLFNTLHTISMLIEENPPAATRTLVLLGDLLRQTLALADVAEVSLG